MPDWNFLMKKRRNKKIFNKLSIDLICNFCLILKNFLLFFLYSLKDPSFFSSWSTSFIFLNIITSISIKRKRFDDLILLQMNSHSFLSRCIVYGWFWRRSYFYMWPWSMRWWSITPPIFLPTKISIQKSFRYRFVFFFDWFILYRLLLFLFFMFLLAFI